MKISMLIVGAILASLMVAVSLNFIGALQEEYDITVDANTSEFETFNQITLLKDQTDAINTKVLNVSEQSGVLDVIGSYFSSAFDAFRLTFQSYDVVESMVNTGIDNSGLGTNASIFKDALLTILLILVIVGVVISALLKRDV